MSTPSTSLAGVDHVGAAARWLDDHFARLVAERGVPGASLALLAGGRLVTAAAGVTSLATGVPVDTSTVFQIGSITKIWTTTLVMQLVDEGVLDLDAPLLDHLPELVIGDMDVAKQLTTRHLLTHTAGFEGDIFTDTGRGDDAIERYVATLTDLPQLFAPGETFSYNNTAFVILGRLVEVLRRQTYDEALLERIARPLGLERVSPSPYEAILHRAATGHVVNEDGSWSAAPTWALARSNAPAGSMLAMTPTDLLGFVRMHLDGGTAPDGARVLGADSVKAMQTRQVDLPRLSGMGDAWGLGWELFDTASGHGAVVAHDGGTIGQAAFLRVVPEAGVAIAMLTNGGDVLGLFNDVVATLLTDLTGVVLPDRPTPPAEPSGPPDVSRYLGHYADTIYDIEVSQDADGRVWLDRVPKDVIAEIGERPIRFELVHLSGDSLITVEPVHGMHVVFAFIGSAPDPSGADRAKYVHYGRVVARAD